MRASMWTIEKWERMASAAVAIEIANCRRRSVREVAEIYESEKFYFFEVHRALSGLHSTALIALERYGFTNTSETPPTVNEVYLHLHTVNHDGVSFIDTRSERFYAKLQRRRLELTQATLDQAVDDEAVYFNVAGECLKGRVYGLGSLGRKKRRYADPCASTSQMPEMVPCSEFATVAEQLRQVVAFMQRQFRMTMDGAAYLTRPTTTTTTTTTTTHERASGMQANRSRHPPQRTDNVEQDMQYWLTRDEQLGDT
ncbi:hypothetical protein Scep_001807 [Stephania cephalantha]|uniref:Uncharacterized protein n=1 Tax=Stephania cephalantha TaxID=152367 RepID=A0AAP0Q847_9MAGN